MRDSLFLTLWKGRECVEKDRKRLNRRHMVKKVLIRAVVFLLVLALAIVAFTLSGSTR